MENPINPWDDLGGFSPTIFGVTSIWFFTTSKVFFLGVAFPQLYITESWLRWLDSRNWRRLQSSACLIRPKQPKDNIWNWILASWILVFRLPYCLLLLFFGSWLCKLEIWNWTKSEWRQGDHCRNMIWIYLNLFLDSYTHSFTFAREHRNCSLLQRIWSLSIFYTNYILYIFHYPR